MDNKRKKYIDDLWKHTEYGQWVMLSAKGKTKKADDLAEKIIVNFPFSLDAIEADLSTEIAKAIDDESEFDDYMKMLDEEDSDLVEFMILHDTFGKVYDLLKDKQ